MKPEVCILLYRPKERIIMSHSYRAGYNILHKGRAVYGGEEDIRKEKNQAHGEEKIVKIKCRHFLLTADKCSERMLIECHACVKSVGKKRRSPPQYYVFPFFLPIASMQQIHFAKV